MKLNPKVTGALAWGGLIVILAVPSVDLMTRPQGAAATSVVSDLDGVRTASVGVPLPTVKKPVLATEKDPVEELVSSGRKLPSYISDAPETAAVKDPATTIRLTVPGKSGSGAASAKTEVAAVAPVTVAEPIVAPVPYPASKRPKASTAPTATAAASATGAGPLIIDESAVARREAAVARVLADEPGSSDFVDGDELEEWDSGSLAEYLERRGMLNDGEGQQASNDFDDEDFFLDEERDSRSDRRVVRRVERRDFFFF